MINERPIKAVPLSITVLLILSFLAHSAFKSLQHDTGPVIPLLALPPPAALVTIATLNDPILASRLLALVAQSSDVSAGHLAPMRDLDYNRLSSWLELSASFDRQSQYPIFLAASVFGAVNEPQRSKAMYALVRRAFRLRPAAHWRHMAQITVLARHRLNDIDLALRYARDLNQYTAHLKLPAWVREMEVFILEDLNELEQTRIVLGGLIASGQITDPNELQFLNAKLKALEEAAKPSKSQQPVE